MSEHCSFDDNPVYAMVLLPNAKAHWNLCEKHFGVAIEACKDENTTRNRALEEAAKVADEQTNTHTKQYLAYSGPAEFSPFAVYSQACGDIAAAIRALKP